MSALVIPYDFVGGTSILSSQVDANFQAVAAVVNGALDDTNLAALAAIQRSKIASGTANHVVINSAGGALSSEATLALTRGGTGQATATAAFNALSPLTTTGDIIYASGANTAARLPAGSNGQALIQASGIPSWSWGAITTKTTTYAIANTDETILCSGSAFTVTLPTAVGITGKQFLIKKTDSSLTNIVTIATTSSQTIDGVTSSTLNTENETLIVQSDRANWAVLQRRIPSIWNTFTPTGTWVNVQTVYTGRWRRIGDTVEVDYFLALGAAPTAANLSLNLPTGITIDTTKMPGSANVDMGRGVVSIRKSGAATYAGSAQYSSTSAVAIQYYDDAAAGVVLQGAVNATAPVTFANLDTISCKIAAPVSGWNT